MIGLACTPSMLGALLGSSEKIVYTMCHDAFQQNRGEEPYVMTDMHAAVHN